MGHPIMVMMSYLGRKKNYPVCKEEYRGPDPSNQAQKDISPN